MVKISCYQHLKDFVNSKGTGLLPGGEILPDDLEYCEDKNIYWIPGARDILKGAVAEALKIEDSDKIEEIVGFLKRLDYNYKDRDIENLESILKYRETLSIIDKVLQKIITDPDINQGLLYKICRNLLFSSSYRGVVKFCIAILGLFDIPDDIEVFKFFSLHEEFTLYGAVAVISGNGDAAIDWLEMARNVKGWGRIHLVDRLVKSKRNDVREFLLKEGYKNIISENYTAVSIAEAVRLGNILSCDEIDRESFVGAGAILYSLSCNLGEKLPFKGIEAYNDNLRAILGYLKHAKKYSESIKDFLVVNSLVNLVRPVKIENRELINFEEKYCNQILEIGEEILCRNIWVDKVNEGLLSDDFKVLSEAIEASEILGINSGDILFKKLYNNFEKKSLWNILSTKANSEIAYKLVNLAMEHFIKEESSLERIIKRERIEVHNLNYLIAEKILDMLYNYPSMGVELFIYILKKGDSELRLKALRNLVVWPDDVELSRKLYNSLQESLKDNEEMVVISAEHIIRKWYKDR